MIKYLSLRFSFLGCFSLRCSSLKLFSSVKSYDKYLNDHIKKSLENVSTPNKIKSKNVCEQYFERLMLTQIKQEQFLRVKINMIFSASFQLQNFDLQRNQICKMILRQKIKSQSELDRVLKFVIKQLKFNSGISRVEIQKYLEDGQIKSLNFKEEWLKDYTSNKAQFNIKSLNMISKKYREKYPQVDSKFIYDEINNLLKGNQRSAQIIINKKVNQPLQIHQNKFWDKIQNIKPRLLKQELNTPEIYQEHKRITQGKLRFRFPPQPNGYLHIGHLKSIRMNFQTAKRLNGECYLRYDDTNPEKQTPEFIQQIENNVKWMGYTPDKIKFTSDYFEPMMDYANQLIKQGHAYVCESSQEQIQLQRKQKRSNPYRLKDKSFSERLFPHFTQTQTLRLKLFPQSPNPTLRDPIIYRYKSSPHPKTGTKYKIYPMYDFAHCISDSIEHIDYSLCSLQFQIRRQLYYKILDMLGLYKPIVWQFSRLNIKGNVISKRKIKQLIDESKIQGWDDPRLLTIKGMQRKGYTPKMLYQFIDKVNSSRSGNQKYVRVEVLQKQMKKQLALSAIKLMAIKKPFRIAFIGTEEKSTIINHSKLQNKDIKNIKVSSQIYIQSQQVHKLIQSTQIILKYNGVFTPVIQGDIIFLKRSLKTVDQAKKQNQHIPILCWIPQNHIQKKIVFYSSNLIDEQEQFIEQSKKLQSLYVSRQFDQLLEKDQNQVFLFQRIGYFKKDNKTQDIICCVQV